MADLARLMTQTIGDNPSGEQLRQRIGFLMPMLIAAHRRPDEYLAALERLPTKWSGRVLFALYETQLVTETEILAWYSVCRDPQHLAKTVDNFVRFLGN